MLPLVSPVTPECVAHTGCRNEVACLAMRRQLHAGDACPVSDHILCNRERAVGI